MQFHATGAGATASLATNLTAGATAIAPGTVAPCAAAPPAAISAGLLDPRMG